ncbi:mushroom body large-type Kenyon cell-specific protein 1 [Cucumis melo var. makuwa]|uniref:Mushroom body large-type Kenyon cell-specific protein 1 n=1 Tax=Cucumis melo var. makuwa TaxID=1194695 RepID=A0A5D3DDN7_CUCMM|nr:mushroom body large-type Kenyon cell-specific protein 1 [Cucumis melo var. makuwa]
MNDQNSMINQAQMISMNHPQMANQPPHVINQQQVINQPQFLNQSQVMNHSQIISPNLLPQQPQAMLQSGRIISQTQPPMMNGNYKVWGHPQAPLDPNKKFRNFPKPNYGNMKQSGSGRGNWKGKGVSDKRTNNRRSVKPLPGSLSAQNNGGGYQPPSLYELQSQNRNKARKFYSKKKFNNRFAPYAPRNTSSFIIRAKKSGGIASLVSPCPVTPAVLPSPMFSPSREALGDMAKEEWGVDGYGSMKGLIRLRGSENKAEVQVEEEEEGSGGSSDSDVEEHLEVERRLDHDLSRFEMIYQNYGVEYNNCLENTVDDQDSHIAQLEEENLTLKERLFIMETEVVELRRKLQLLEGGSAAIDDVNEEVVENVSENESDGGLEIEYLSEIRQNQDINVDSKEEDEKVLEIEGKS